MINNLYNQLKRHIEQRHTTLHNVTCRGCNTTLVQKYNLKPHLLVCKAAKSNPGKIACEHCGHLADNKVDLKVHMDAEHKDRVSQMEKRKKQAAAKASNNNVRIRKFFKMREQNLTQLL